MDVSGMKDSRAPSVDRRVLRTRSALARALLTLVEERELSRIGVSDVAERAGVSRTAFYDHYRDVHELAEAACTAMIDGLTRSLPKPRRDSADLEGEATRSLEAFFASLAEHAGLYRSLLGPQGSARVADHIRRRLTDGVREHVREAHDVPAAFTAGAIYGVAADWLQRGCPEPPARMAALTWPLFHALYDVVSTSPPPAP